MSAPVRMHVIVCACSGMHAQVEQALGKTGVLRTVLSRCRQLYVQTCCHNPFWRVLPSQGFGELVLEYYEERKETPCCVPSCIFLRDFERFGTRRVVAELSPGQALSSQRYPPKVEYPGRSWELESRELPQ